MKLTEAISGYWLTYAPMWIWSPVNRLCEFGAKIAYRLGRRVRCLAWYGNPVIGERGKVYVMTGCELPKGHPGLHVRDGYEWKEWHGRTGF